MIHVSNSSPNQMNELIMSKYEIMTSSKTNDNNTNRICQLAEYCCEFKSKLYKTGTVMYEKEQKISQIIDNLSSYADDNNYKLIRKIPNYIQTESDWNKIKDDYIKFELITSSQEVDLPTHKYKSLDSEFVYEDNTDSDYSSDKEENETYDNHRWY